MRISKPKKDNHSQNIASLPQSVVLNTRVFVAVDGEGNIIHSRVVPCTEGEDAGKYYQRLAKIEQELDKSCKQKAHSCRVYSGTADSVDGFLTIFPEIVRPCPPRREKR